MTVLMLLVSLIICTTPAIAKDEAFRIEQDLSVGSHGEVISQSKLISFVDNNEFIKKCRYGKGKKELGSYAPGPEMKFRTNYKNLGDGDRTLWALKLGTWYEKIGGGYENFEKRKKAGKSAGFCRANYEMPYLKLEDFAKKYWKDNKEYKKSGLTPKDWFLHEALIDGMAIWLYSNQVTNKYGPEEGKRISKYLKQIKNRKPRM